MSGYRFDRLKVLVVDDNAHMRKLVTTILQAFGVVQIYEAENGQRAWSVLRESNPDVLVLCHGGPISEPADAEYVLRHTRGVVGFFGASSIERLPTEVAITACVRQFKGIAV